MLTRSLNYRQGLFVLLLGNEQHTLVLQQYNDAHLLRKATTINNYSYHSYIVCWCVGWRGSLYKLEGVIPVYL